jgi:hypothetical protein
MADIKLTQVSWSTPFETEPDRANGFPDTVNNAQLAIEYAKQNAEGFPRAGVRGQYNGTVGNNDWLGPNELMPNTPLVVFPVDTKLNEITWSNQNTNVQFRIQFRTVSKTGTIFYTMTVTSPNPGYGYISGLNYTFSPGDVIYAQYLDDGQNCSDMDLILWISRIPAP